MPLGYASQSSCMCSRTFNLYNYWWILEAWAGRRNLWTPVVTSYGMLNPKIGVRYAICQLNHTNYTIEYTILREFDTYSKKKRNPSSSTLWYLEGDEERPAGCAPPWEPSPCLVSTPPNLTYPPLSLSCLAINIQVEQKTPVLPLLSQCWQLHRWVSWKIWQFHKYEQTLQLSPLITSSLNFLAIRLPES